MKKIKLTSKEKQFLLSQLDYLAQIYDTKIKITKQKVLLNDSDIKNKEKSLEKYKSSQKKLFQIYNKIYNSEPYLNNSKKIIIDLNSENHNTKFLYGKDNGKKERTLLNIKKLEKEYEQIIFVVNKNIPHISTSFFKGLLSKSIKKYKNPEKFKEKFILKTNYNNIKISFETFISDSFN